MKKNKQKKIEKKKIQSTLDWLHIDKVHEQHVELKKGKKKEFVVGVKLVPHAIFLDSYHEQLRRIHLLRNAMNRLTFDLWHGFVFNPVNLDTYLLMLVKQMAVESDEVIKEMLQDDIDKAMAFTQVYRELEFFILIKNKPGKKLEDQYSQLLSAVKSAGFQFKPLTRLDFDNYIAHSFENQLVNNFYFSRGVFGEEKEDIEHVGS